VLPAAASHSTEAADQGLLQMTTEGTAAAEPLGVTPAAGEPSAPQLQAPATSAVLDAADAAAEGPLKAPTAQPQQQQQDGGDDVTAAVLEGPGQAAAAQEPPAEAEGAAWPQPTELCRLEGHKNDVLLLLFSPDGEGIATGSKDGHVRVSRHIHMQQPHLPARYACCKDHQVQCHCRQTKHICTLQVWRKERRRGKRPQAWVQRHTLASPPQPEEQPAAARRRRPPPVLKVNQIAWTSDNARVRPKAAVPVTAHRSVYRLVAAPQLLCCNTLRTTHLLLFAAEDKHLVKAASTTLRLPLCAEAY
jgi:hypothetical protein